MKKFIVLVMTACFVVACGEKKVNQEITSDDSISIHNQLSIDAGVDSVINNKASRKESKIGKYLYIDKGHCLHIDKDCIALIEDHIILTGSNESEELSINSTKYALYRVNREELTHRMLTYCCRYCIDDNVYEQLVDIAHE